MKKPKKNKGGRPRVADKAVTVTFRLPQSMLAKLRTISDKPSTTIAAVVSRWIARHK